MRISPVIIFLLVFLLPVSLPASETTINRVVVVGNHAPPFRIIKNGEFEGIYFDIMREIGKRLGIVVEYKQVPFKRALNMMEAGTADIMLGPNRTPERESYMIYTRATIGRANKVFYGLSSAALISEYEDLRDKDILVHRGKVYFRRFDEDQSLNKIPVNSYQDGINIISRGRGDVIIMPEQEGDYLLKGLGVKLIKSPYVIPGNESYITLSRQSAVSAIRDHIDASFFELERDGTLDAILSRYRLE